MYCRDTVRDGSEAKPLYLFARMNHSDTGDTKKGATKSKSDVVHLKITTVVILQHDDGARP
jgi:hypothetical protein